MSFSESLPLHGRSNQLPVSHESLLAFPRNPIAEMRRLHREFGDLAVLEDEGQRIAFIFSPEYNRIVLSDTKTFHSRFFAVRGSRRSAQRRVTSGLLSMNGAEHREGRRIMMDVFQRKVLPEYHNTICELTDSLLADWKPGQTRDLNTEMVEFMLRLTGALLFGIDDGDYAVQLGSMIDRWVRQNHEVGMGALVSSKKFTEGYERLLTQAEELEASIREMFQRRHSHANGGKRSDVLSLLFQAQASGEQLNDETLIGHATLTFAAAHLTTAHTFSWTLFLLSQHPHVMQRLAEELEAHTTGDHPTFEELQSLPYLEWVIKESMRVMPASAYSQRVVSEPTELGPVHLPAGTPVIFSQYITHHRADLFDDPDTFNPDRWAKITPSPYAYLPFGAGPRMCIGAPLAMVELRTALAVMMKRYHLQMQANSIVNGQVISTMLGPTSSINAIVISPTEIPQTVTVHGTIHDLVRLPAEARPETIRRAA